MKKQLTPTAIKSYKTKDGKEITTLVLKTSYTSPPCKECKKNPRQDGASRCSDCTNSFKRKKFYKEKVQSIINKSNNKNK